MTTKHVKAVTRRPFRAADYSTGGIFRLISQIFSVFADFFTQKEAQEEED